MDARVDDEDELRRDAEPATTVADQHVFVDLGVALHQIHPCGAPLPGTVLIGDVMPAWRKSICNCLMMGSTEILECHGIWSNFTDFPEYPGIRSNTAKDY